MFMELEARWRTCKVVHHHHYRHEIETLKKKSFKVRITLNYLLTTKWAIEDQSSIIQRQYNWCVCHFLVGGQNLYMEGQFYCHICGKENAASLIIPHISKEWWWVICLVQCFFFFFKNNNNNNSMFLTRMNNFDQVLDQRIV